MEVLILVLMLFLIAYVAKRFLKSIKTQAHEEKHKHKTGFKTTGSRKRR